MIDPNNPIIDPRTTLVGEQQPAAASAGSGGSTPPPKQPAATPAPITPAGSSSSSATVKTTSTVPIATTIPEQYTASSYAELIPPMENPGGGDHVTRVRLTPWPFLGLTIDN